MCCSTKSQLMNSNKGFHSSMGPLWSGAVGRTSAFCDGGGFGKAGFTDLK